MKISGMVLTVLMLFPLSLLSADEAGSKREALRDIRSGWKQQLLYEQTFVSPQSLCYDGSGNLYVYEYGRKMVYRMRPDWSAEEFVHTGDIALRTIAWQPGHRRLIGFDDHTMYVLYPGPFRKLRSLDSPSLVSTVAVDPSDDSLFAAHEEPGKPLVHLDSDGSLLKILKREVRGCSQIAFDPAEKILYFSETFAGSASAIDLRTGKSEIIIDSVAEAGTQEPIMIWLDANLSLWYYTAKEGLFCAYGDGFRQVSLPMMGAGRVVWSPVIDNFVAIEYAGSNLVTFDYTLGERVDLTPYLNANTIAVDTRGRIFYPRYEFIHMLDEGVLVPFAGPLPDICDHVESDTSGFIYAALLNGALYRFDSQGSGGEWAAGYHKIEALGYDSSAHDIIVADKMEDQITLYRIPAENPAAAVPVVRFPEAAGGNLKRLTVDSSGVIYMYDRGPDALYLVDEERGILTKLFGNILLSPDITTPGFEYSSIEDAFIFGTLEYYRTVDRQTGKRGALAVNRHGADNFAVEEAPDGSLYFIHSGQIFRLYR